MHIHVFIYYIYVKMNLLQGRELFYAIPFFPGSSTYLSCLENPRDGGAWWAAIYGVAQSQIGLKQLSSSSSSTYLSTWHAYVCAKSFCHIWLFATLWTVAYQAPLSQVFCRQQYWSELPCLPPGSLPDPGIEPASLCLLHWQTGCLPLVPLGSPSVHDETY